MATIGQSTTSRKGAATLLARAAIIARCTDKPGEIMRTFLSPAMEEVHRCMRPWFEAAGMRVTVDTAGNLRGVYAPDSGDSLPILLIGSHLDSVPNAGAYDGILGVLMGLALVEGLGGRRMPYAIEVVGFSDEEGTRFGIPFIGSRALTGTLSDAKLLDSKDALGVSVREALMQYCANHPDASDCSLSPNTRAFLEYHIEQGPILESRNLPLGIVSSLVGQSRCRLVFQGSAGHAGTSPMVLRRDALAAAAAWMTRCESIAIEIEGLVATVGQISVEPGGVNVIPGVARCSLDVRHADDSVREQAVEAILREARAMGAQRGVLIEAEEYHSQPAVQLDSAMTLLAEKAVHSSDYQHIRMTSGAGHDAMVIAPHLPTAMIFLRSPGGISHHPDERVLPEDVEAAIQAGLCFLDEFAVFATRKESNQRA